MIKPEEKALFKHLEELSGWDIAAHFGCSYSGDSNPLEHGGYFYDHRDWTRWGYAKAVEFSWNYERGRCLVECGTINRLEGEKLDDAFACCGITDPEMKGNVHAQIEACRSYAGFEADEVRTKGYRLEYWREWRIWKSVSPWLKELGRAQ